MVEHGTISFSFIHVNAILLKVIYVEKVCGLSMSIGIMHYEKQISQLKTF